MGGTGPAALLRGHLECLLAMAEVRVWKGNKDPTSEPWGSPHPRRGDDEACFTAFDPALVRGFEDGGGI